MTDQSDPITNAVLLEHMQAGLESVRSEIKGAEKRLEAKLGKRIDALDEKIEKKTKWLQEGIDQTLVVLGNMEKKHDERMYRTEKRLDVVETHIGLAA